MSTTDNPSVRIFSHADQIRFAELSGDWNPIHIDPVVARRTPYGQIVHGVHSLAWALDTYMGEPGAGSPVRVSSGFLRPIRLMEEVRLIRSEEGQDVQFFIQACGSTLASIRITPGASRYSARCVPVPESTSRIPESKSFQDLRGATGSIDAWGDEASLNERFHHLVKTWGSLRTAALLGLSRLVGMNCPGYHSLFSGLEFGIQPSDDPRLHYKVIRHSITNAPLRIEFSGGGLAGTVDAFFRPPPATQIRMEDLRSLVSPDEFRGQTALIIGGSRGLGESMAKIIAAGGGFPVITYHQGLEDAKRVAEDITKYGGRSAILPFDVQDVDRGCEELAATGVTPSHLYYFASPRIRSNKGPVLDRSLLDSYMSCYVDAFGRTCRKLSLGTGVRVFYPSTVYLSRPAPGFAEYISAKAAGESLCASLAKECAKLSFMVERLPRMHTDQTNSLLEARAADAHAILLGVARKMSR